MNIESMPPGDEQEKQVLIVTYYWPPFGGSGVQRWLKFVKYLPSLGWTPFIFTPENPAFGLRDESLLLDVPAEAEVIHFPIWEPYQLASLFTGRKRNTGQVSPVLTSPKGFLQRCARWIRANFLIPDPRRFWVRPSVSFLEDFIVEKRIHTVVTTGPPHSVHLIGRKLKKKIPSLNWVADFRDPWSQWGLLDSLGTGGLARGTHRRLERGVLQHANSVVTITPFYQKQFERLGERKVHLVTNGYDEDDFTGFIPESQDVFIVRHVGVVNERCDPQPFLEAASTWYSQNAEIHDKFRIEFVGEVHERIRLFAEQDPVLQQIVKFIAPVSHNQLMKLYRSSALHLLVLTGYKDAAGYLPGKLFEYLATGIPVLGVGPVEGDAATMIREVGAGKMVSSDDQEGLVRALSEYFGTWKRGDQLFTNPPAQYTRRILTGQMVSFFR